jgi:hypothetical protein
MNRRAMALVVALGAATMLAACGSGGLATAPATPVPGSYFASPGPSPTPSSAPATSATPAPTPPMATASPAPSPFPGPTYVPAPQPSLALPASGAPAIPTGSRLDFPTAACISMNPNESCESLRVTWLEANPTGVTIRVYAVTTCLHIPSASMRSAACLVDGDTIPIGFLVLLSSAPASAGSFSFVLGVGETTAFGWLPGFGPDVDAVVLQGINTHGGSAFAIAGSSGSCWGCTL